VCCGKGAVVDYFIIVFARVLIRKLCTLVLCCYLQIRSLSIMTLPLNNFSQPRRQQRRRVQIKKFSDSFSIPISRFYCLRERWLAANVCPFSQCALRAANGLYAALSRVPRWRARVQKTQFSRIPHQIFPFNFD
jgi:hypothetical protein